MSAARQTNNNMVDQVVVSFHNSLLRESDLSLLDGPRWLNDKLIGFAFEYFEYEQFAGKVDKMAFISPEVTQYIKMSGEDEIGIFVTPLDLPQKDHIFLAVNNNSSYSTVGGSHWSLLVYNKENQSFSHFDSMSRSNSMEAKQLVIQLQPLVTETGIANYVDEVCPQQQNGYDCGLFVVCIAEYLCRKYITGDSSSIIEAVTQKTVSAKRQQLKEVIQELSKKSVER